MQKSRESNAKRKKARRRVRLPVAERALARPRDVEAQFDISDTTRWRWERDGKLPKRDMFLGGEAIGWRPATLGIGGKS